MKNTGVISKAMPSSKKASLGVLFWEARHVGNHFRGGHASEHAHFKVIVQKRKMVDGHTSGHALTQIHRAHA